MAFSTKNAKRQPLSLELRDWSATCAPEERRTVVLELLPGTDLDQLGLQLDALEAEVVSIGEAVTIATIACQALDEASKLPGVVSIDSPTQMSPKE